MKFLTLALLLFSVSCASRKVARVEDLNLGLPQIKRAVVDNLPEGVREISINGRDYFSHYYLPVKGGKYVRADNYKKRFYAHVSIVGDRRPYVLTVAVHQEQLNNDKSTAVVEYSEVNQDKRRALFLAKKIVKSLTQRPKDLNFIDDFRIF